MVAVAEKKYTVEEYFGLEKTSDVRHEYVLGKLIPMPGESKNANKINFNCASKLHELLETRRLEIFQHDVRLIVEAGRIYRYPGLVVAPEADDEDSHAVTQPVLIIEVVSESTASEDRGPKLREYCSLPTLQHYLIVAQDKMDVEMYSRQESGGWLLEFFLEENAVIKMRALSVNIPLKDIYRKVKFDENAA